MPVPSTDKSQPQRCTVSVSQVSTGSGKTRCNLFGFLQWNKLPIRQFLKFMTKMLLTADPLHVTCVLLIRIRHTYKLIDSTCRNERSLCGIRRRAEPTIAGALAKAADRTGGLNRRRETKYS
jgi:hypothetical protein